MRRLTLSSMDRAQHCLWPYRDDVEWAPYSRNQPADCGNALHEHAYNAISRIADEDLGVKWGLDGEHAAKLLEFTAHWDHRWPEPGEWDFAEVAVALNVITGKVRILGININRQYDEYGAGPDDVCGTADAVAVLSDRVRVADWKTGRQYALTRWGNLQVRSLAAAIATYYNKPIAETLIEVIDEEGIRDYPETMNLDEIQKAIADVVDKAEEIELTAPEPHIGTHCDNCKAAAACPEAARATAALAYPLPALATREDVVDVIGKLTAYEAQAEAIWAIVKARSVEMGGVDVGDGRVFGPYVRTTESISVDGPALEALAHHGVDVAVKKKITKASIQEAVKAVSARGKAAGKFREVMASLRAAGSAKDSAHEVIGFHKQGAQGE